MMKNKLAAIGIFAIMTAPSAFSQDAGEGVDYEPIPKFLTTPDEVESTRLGKLIFKDGYPTQETVPNSEVIAHE